VEFVHRLTPEEMTEYYRMADILVVPSWYEPFGMVILEGMLHGLAIAASDIGGPAEILRHETTGLLFPPRNVDALVAALLRLVSDANLRQCLGAAAGAAVRRRWLWPRLIADMRSVYREVANVK
jgi:glycosyltransferase involved in cell wall biosynthesis